MKLLAYIASTFASALLAQAARAPSLSPVLLWSTNPQLFNNDEVSNRMTMSQVFDLLLQSLDTAPESAPYLVIHMLPRGIQTKTILVSENEETAPSRLFKDPTYGSRLFFPNVTKTKDFDITDNWADLFQKIHIPQHQQDKRRIGILTNREVQEDDEAYKVVLPAAAFVFDQIAERLGDTRILLIEGAALLQSNGNDSSHWTILSALMGSTERDVLVISADIDPPLPKKIRRRGATRRMLQGVLKDGRAEGDVVLNVKPGQLAIFIFIGAFVFATISAVFCTMQINTPALYLEKTIPINKEFQEGRCVFGVCILGVDAKKKRNHHVRMLSRDVPARSGAVLDAFF